MLKGQNKLQKTVHSFPEATSYMFVEHQLSSASTQFTSWDTHVSNLTHSQCGVDHVLIYFCTIYGTKLMSLMWYLYTFLLQYDRTTW